MQKRTIAGIDKASSVVGFGAWGIGGATPGATSYGELDETTAVAIINAAYAGGMRFFDTSPAYGYGKSEQRLGFALRDKREECIIATKGGLYQYDSEPDFSENKLVSELEHSLERLQTQYVDIFQLHNPPKELLKTQPELKPLFDHIKSTGKARSVGISTKSPEEAVDLLKAYPFDTVQVNFNMLDVRALTCGLLDYCAAHNISVFARTPLCFGFLSLQLDEQTQFSEGDHRTCWPLEQKRVWIKGAYSAQFIATSHDTVETSAASRALRFCLLHDAVKTVLTGPMTENEAVENAFAGSEPALDLKCLNDIRQLNQKQSFVLKA